MTRRADGCIVPEMDNNIGNSWTKRLGHLLTIYASSNTNVVSESFDDLDSLGEFVDTLFYMHSITDDEQFAVFLGMM